GKLLNPDPYAPSPEHGARLQTDVPDKLCLADKKALTVTLSVYAANYVRRELNLAPMTMCQGDGLSLRVFVLYVAVHPKTTEYLRGVESFKDADFDHALAMFEEAYASSGAKDMSKLAEGEKEYHRLLR